MLYRPSRTVHILWLGRGHARRRRGRLRPPGEGAHDPATSSTAGCPLDGRQPSLRLDRDPGRVRRLDFDRAAAGPRRGAREAKTSSRLWREYLRDLMDGAARPFRTGPAWPRRARAWRAPCARRARPAFGASRRQHCDAATWTAPTGWSAGRWSSPRPARPVHGHPRSRAASSSGAWPPPGNRAPGPARPPTCSASVGAAPPAARGVAVSSKRFTCPRVPAVK